MILFLALGSFLTCMHWSVLTSEYLRGSLCRSQEFLSPFSSLLSRILPCKHQLPWPPQTLSIQGDHCTLPEFPLPALQLENSLQVASQSNHKAHLICFPSLRNHSFAAQRPKSRKPLFLYILFGFLAISGRRVNMALFHQKWKLRPIFLSLLSSWIILKQLLDIFHCYILVCLSKNLDFLDNRVTAILNKLNNSLVWSNNRSILHFPNFVKFFSFKQLVVEIFFLILAFNEHYFVKGYNTKCLISITLFNLQ